MASSVHGTRPGPAEAGLASRRPQSVGCTGPHPASPVIPNSFASGIGVDKKSKRTGVRRRSVKRACLASRSDKARPERDSANQRRGYNGGSACGFPVESRQWSARAAKTCPAVHAILRHGTCPTQHPLSERATGLIPQLASSRGHTY